MISISESYESPVNKARIGWLIGIKVADDAAAERQRLGRIAKRRRQFRGIIEVSVACLEVSLLELRRIVY